MEQYRKELAEAYSTIDRLTAKSKDHDEWLDALRILHNVQRDTGLITSWSIAGVTAKGLVDAAAELRATAESFGTGLYDVRALIRRAAEDPAQTGLPSFSKSSAQGKALCCLIAPDANIRFKRGKPVDPR